MAWRMTGLRAFLFYVESVRMRIQNSEYSTRTDCRRTAVQTVRTDRPSVDVTLNSLNSELLRTHVAG